MLKTPLAAAFLAALVPNLFAQLGRHPASAGEADLSAFELPSGAVRVRLRGGPPLGAGLLWLTTRNGTRARTAFPLDASGTFWWDLPRDVAASLAGARLEVLLRGPAGTAAPANTLVLRDWAAAAPTQRGDVVFSEFMKDPTAVPDSSGEWVELYNPGQKPRQIAGWLLHDGGTNAHVIQPGGPFILVPPGGRFLMGNQKDPLLNGGVPVQYQYSGFSLSNGADELFLTARNGSLVDSVIYDNGVLWPDTPGKSISLDPSALDAIQNDDPAHWCEASSPLTATSPDFGTPGAPNDVCP